MDKIEKMKQQKQYEKYVKQKTPTPSVLKNTEGICHRRNYMHDRADYI